MTTQELLHRAKAAKTAMALADTRDERTGRCPPWRTPWSGTRTDILAANQLDLEAAKGSYLLRSCWTGLALSPDRIAGMAKGIREVVELPDPVGAVLASGWSGPAALWWRKTAVPMGVIAIIYESRPNVTSDAAALALKAGSACVLRGGKEAHRSAAAIVAALKEGLVRRRAARGRPPAGGGHHPRLGQ